MNRVKVSAYVDGASTASSSRTLHDPETGGKQLPLRGLGAGVEVEIEVISGDAWRLETVGLEFNVQGGAK